MTERAAVVTAVGHEEAPPLSYIEVEPEEGFWPGSRTVRIPLPFEVLLRRRWLGWSLLAVVFALGLFMLWAAASLFLPNFGNSDILTFLVIFPIGLGFGTLLCAGAVIHTADLWRKRPVVSVDDNGVWDRRQTTRPVRWDEILSVTGPEHLFSIIFRLRDDIDARRNPLRFGAWRYLFIQRRDHLVVPRILLVQEHLVCQVVAKLAEKHGVRVVAR